MREIPLSRGMVALVDDSDYSFLNQWKWCISPGARTSYATRNQYARGEKPKAILMHRLLLNAPSGLLTDHIDGNGLNNVRSNLRLATPLQNMMNRRPKAGGTSVFKGVWFDATAPRKPWRAGIRLSGKLHYLGRFADERSAAEAYQAASLEHFGVFHKPIEGMR